MTRIFSLALLAVAVAVAIVAMAMGGVAAQEQENASTTNETVTEHEWPTNASNVTVDDARAALKEPVDELPTETIRAVGEWASDSDNFRELGASERERLTEYLAEAQARDAIDGIDLPDLERDQAGGDGDRADRDDDQEENETSEQPVEDESESATPIDEDVTLTEWSYSHGAFSLTFEHSGERPTHVTIQEATQGDEGTRRFTWRNERLLPGETTLTVSAQEINGEAAVGITTSKSQQEGYGIEVSTGNAGEDPFAPFGGTSGIFTGVFLAMMMSGGAAGWVLWQEETGVIKA